MRSFTTYCLLIFATLIASGQSLGKGVLQEADSLCNSGQYVEAIARYDSIILSSKNGALLFDCLSSRAYCHKMLSNYSLALADYNQALSIVSYGPSAQNIMLNKSDLLIQMGQYKQAQELLEGLKLTDVSKEAHRLSNLAAALIGQEKRGEAFALLEKIINDTTIDASIRAAALHNRGNAFLDSVGYAGNAVSDLSRALKLFDGPRKYIVLANLATAQSMNGQHTDALSNIEQVLSWQKNNLSANHPNYIISLRKKAEILWRMGRRKEAQVWFKQYFDAERKDVSKNFASMTEQQRIDYWKKEKPLISEIFALENDCPEFLLDVALFRREIALLGAQDTARNMSRRLAILGKDVISSLRENEVAIDFVCYAKLNESTNSNVDYYGAVVVKPGKKKKVVEFVPLWSAVELNAFRLNNGKKLYDAVCSRDKVNKNYIYNDSLLAQFVWKPLLQHIPLGSKVYFAPDGLFHILAIEYLPNRALEQKDLELHRVTSIARLLDRGKGHSETGQRLVVGGLNYNYVDKINDDIGTKANHDAVNYLFENFGRFSFKPLKGTIKEADSVAFYQNKSQVTNIQTEKTLKTNMGQYQRLHLSTHGYALQVNDPPVPLAQRDSITLDRSLLASGIVLTGANRAYLFDGIDDGIISARELCDMDLHNIEFLVLSACQTALGQLSDEGPAGLVRGFKKAGAKTILATLWEVDDLATQYLMTEFYKILKGDGKNKEKKTKHQALLEAQDWLRKYKMQIMVFSEETLCDELPPRESPDFHEDTIFNAPYYWAAFILIDDIE